MTRSLLFTEQAIRRAVRGGESTGRRVSGFTVSPDGNITVLFDCSGSPGKQDLTETPKPRDAREKLGVY